MSEQWRSIFDGAYEVSDLGRLRNARGIMRPIWTYQRGRLSQLRVTLCVAGGRISRTVHSLVLEAFVGPRPAGLICRHLDGDPSNNSVANLAWGTALENAGDALRHGTQVRGSRVGSARLTEERVRELFASVAAGTSFKDTAKALGVSCRTVLDTIHGRRWTHVPGRPPQDVIDQFLRDRVHHRDKPWRGNPRLQPAQVVQIRALHQAGAQRRELAERFGVTDNTIKRITTGESWTHL